MLSTELECFIQCWNAFDRVGIPLHRAGIPLYRVGMLSTEMEFLCTGLKCFIVGWNAF
jgi:hypothetical protein